MACSLFPISPGRVPGGGLLSPPGSVSRLETSGSPLVLVSASKSGPLGLLRLLLPGRNCACSPALSTPSSTRSPSRSDPCSVFPFLLLPLSASWARFVAFVRTSSAVTSEAMPGKAFAFSAFASSVKNPSSSFIYF